MDPITISGLIGSGGSLLGSALSYYGTKETNKTNKEIAAMNNKTMLEAMREQTDRDQAYNSVGEQMKRAMAAGINPLTMAGVQPTNVGAASVPSLDTPVMQNPFDAVGNPALPLSDAPIKSKQLGLSEKQIDVSDFSSQVELVKTVADMAKSLNMTAKDANNIIQSILGDRYKGTPVESFAKDEFSMSMLRNQLMSMRLDNSVKSKELKWLDSLRGAQLALMTAQESRELKQIDFLGSQIDLNALEGKLQAASTKMTEAKTQELQQAVLNMREQWKSLNFQGEYDLAKAQNIRKMADALLKKMQADADLTATEAKYWVYSKLLNADLKMYTVMGLNSVGSILFGTDSF